MRKYALTVALICFVAVLPPIALEARQPVVVSGKVTGAQGRPVSAALITAPALNEGTVSDPKGMYQLVIRSKVRSGQWIVIRAGREGFDSVSRPVRLAPGVQLRVNFRLVPDR